MCQLSTTTSSYLLQPSHPFILLPFLQLALLPHNYIAFLSFLLHLRILPSLSYLFFVPISPLATFLLSFSLLLYPPSLIHTSFLRSLFPPLSCILYPLAQPSILSQTIFVFFLHQSFAPDVILCFSPLFHTYHCSLLFFLSLCSSFMQPSFLPS